MIANWDATKRRPWRLWLFAMNGLGNASPHHWQTGAPLPDRHTALPTCRGLPERACPASGDPLSTILDASTLAAARTELPTVRSRAPCMPAHASNHFALVAPLAAPVFRAVLCGITNLVCLNTALALPVDFAGNCWAAALEGFVRFFTASVFAGFAGMATGTAFLFLAFLSGELIVVAPASMTIAGVWGTHALWNCSTIG